MSTLSELTSRRVFIGLVLLSILLLVLVIQPFATAFFVAAVVAGALYPLQKRLTRSLRGRANIAATLVVIGITLLVMAPIAGLTAFVVKEASEGYRYISTTLRSEGMQGLISKLPARVEDPLRKLLDKLEVEPSDLNESVGEKATEQGGAAALVVTGAVAKTGTAVLQTVMMLIALFFLLVDGTTLVQWLESVAPLKPGQTKELLLEFRKVSVAVITSSVATAGVQAAAAMVGYLIARVPNAIFFGLLTFFVALIPAVGATSVCLVASVLLLATGHSGWALFLAIWGFLVVGLVDNIVKPLLVRRGLSMHGAIVFFALLGGIATFGPVGLLVGPMAVAFFMALLRIHQRDYQNRLPPERRDQPVTVTASAQEP